MFEYLRRLTNRYRERQQAESRCRRAFRTLTPDAARKGQAGAAPILFSAFRRFGVFTFSFLVSAAQLTARGDEPLSQSQAALQAYFNLTPEGVAREYKAFILERVGFAPSEASVPTNQQGKKSSR